MEQIWTFRTFLLRFRGRKILQSPGSSVYFQFLLINLAIRRGAAVAALPRREPKRDARVALPRREPERDACAELSLRLHRCH